MTPRKARRISRGAVIAMPEDRKEARNRAQELRSAIKVGVTPQRRDALLCRRQAAPTSGIARCSFGKPPPWHDLPAGSFARVNVALLEFKP